MNTKKSDTKIGLFATLFIFSLVLVVCLFGFLAAGKTVSTESLSATEQAIKRAVVECYALEGAYPPSLEYITQHYGVQVDSDKFYVSYMLYGQNIMPDIMIMPAK